jgi:hypothetical protein
MGHFWTRTTANSHLLHKSDSCRGLSPSCLTVFPLRGMGVSGRRRFSDSTGRVGMPWVLRATTHQSVRGYVSKSIDAEGWHWLGRCGVTTGVPAMVRGFGRLLSGPTPVSAGTRELYLNILHAKFAIEAVSHQIETQPRCHSNPSNRVSTSLRPSG